MAHNLQLLALLNFHTLESDARGCLAVNIERWSLAKDVLKIAVPFPDLRIVQPQFPGRVADGLVLVDDADVVEAAVEGDGGGGCAGRGVV